MKVKNELEARKLHDFSNRKNKPFITLPNFTTNYQFIYSEFFGHEKDSFKKAYTRKIGLVEVANGGSIFIPKGIPKEIKEIIYKKQFKRFGSENFIKINIEIMEEI